MDLESPEEIQRIRDHEKTIAEIKERIRVLERKNQKLRKENEKAENKRAIENQLLISPRLLPARRGMNVQSSLSRSNATLAVTYRQASYELVQAFANVGLTVIPQKRLIVTDAQKDPEGTELMPPSELCVNPFEPFKFCEFYLDLYTKMGLNNISEQSTEGSRPALSEMFTKMVMPYHFTLGIRLIRGDQQHALGCVYVPQAACVFIFDNQYSERPFQWTAEVQKYFLPLDTQILPNAFGKEEEDYNLQEVCDVNYGGFCQQFSFLTPYLMAKENVFSDLRFRSSKANTNTILERAETVQKKYSRPSLTFFNDLLREISLL